MFIGWDTCRLRVENMKGFGNLPEVTRHCSGTMAFSDSKTPQAVLSPDSEDSCEVQPERVIRGVWFFTLFRKTSGFEAFQGVLSELSRQFDPLTLTNYPSFLGSSWGRFRWKR